MRVLITGGGTGGHINPALAIAQKIVEVDDKNSILYVGTKSGMESDLVPKQGFEFETISAKYLERKISLENLKTVAISIKGVVQSMKIIKQYKPDVVVGTGGYVCGPVVLAASLKKIPTMIHEQNVFPGITNKLLSRVVNKIAISFEEASKYFKYKNKLTVVGNPVRKEVINSNRYESRKKFKLKTNDVFIYSFGGSGGQKSLNDAIIRYINTIKNSQNIRLLHVTGKRLYKDFYETLEKENVVIPSNVTVVDYMYDSPSALSASDLVIGSAGAITIAEITKIGVPSILIPKAYTAENHQEYNARALENKGASVVVLERELSGNKLSETIDKIVNNEKQLKAMSLNSKKIGVLNSEEEIFKIILSLYQNKK
ncbi:undecaprenyldiphospho-muramoylpentapeptide beta-N-acetylglucosaminyltransferase [Sedimentibacter sp. zth1]|uniref:undecaprenyldiphospho-muramoylpentapeptide beta-N-acetylglucosaminyltransferase n=1 Tax=Sedimentibacter sp. zth1 TaxID=2816908 RepID=UPI001A922AB1|nr:undecaprenyldiphospho-muramoylpentapeptide beta-N-acetylglucosaminyltransferase [Sedimentibacter sp. zth1]QSX06151.1 undecaprenyldiphospho-muramoylpentapeptide beta-N-acetylglucosaminyltransferase [Sedimentibacter sp. zth1]